MQCKKNFIDRDIKILTFLVSLLVIMLLFAFIKNRTKI